MSQLLANPRWAPDGAANGVLTALAIHCHSTLPRPSSRRVLEKDGIGKAVLSISVFGDRPFLYWTIWNVRNKGPNFYASYESLHICARYAKASALLSCTRSYDCRGAQSVGT